MKFKDMICSILFIKIIYALLLRNNDIDNIQNIEFKFKAFMDYHTKSHQYQLHESSNYDLHVFMVESPHNQLIHSFAEIIKLLPKDNFAVKFVISSYHMHTFLYELSIFSFSKLSSCSIMKFNGIMKHCYQSKDIIFVSNYKNTRLLAARFMLFFKKIFIKLKYLFSNYNGIFLINQKKSSQYSKTVLVEIVKKHIKYDHISLVVILDDMLSRYMIGDFICCEGRRKKCIKNYFVFSLESQDIFNLFEIIRSETKRISFLNFISYKKIQGSKNSKVSDLSNKQSNFDNNYGENHIVMQINKYIIANNYSLNISEKKIKFINFYRISKSGNSVGNMKYVDKYTLYFSRNTIEIKKIGLFSVQDSNSLDIYDLAITIKKTNLDSYILKYKICLLKNMFNNNYDLKNVLLNMKAKNTSEFDELIKIFNDKILN